MNTRLSRFFALVTLGFSALLSGSLGCGGSTGDNTNNNAQAVEIPDIRAFCEGVTPVDVSSPDVTIADGNCNQGAIRNAIEAGGLIVINCPDEVTFNSEIQITQDTVIDGSGVSILSGGDTTQLITKRPGPDLTIQNITLQNGQAPQDTGSADSTNWFNWGGGIVNVLGHNEGGNFTAYNVQFLNGVSAGHDVGEGAGQILDTGNGGALFLFWVQNARIDRCTFDNNSGVNGGAVASLGSRVNITNSVFSNNEALPKGNPANENQGFGGAFYVDGTEQGEGLTDNFIVLCSNQFVNNLAEDAGGAVSLFSRGSTDTDIILNRNSFASNQAGLDGTTVGQGGGLYYFRAANVDHPNYDDVGPDTFFMTENLFQENSAINVGGGVSFQNLYASLGQGFAGEISNNTFYANSVTYDGGGVNDGGYGGAVFGLGIYVDFLHNTFADNTSNNREAGLHLGSSGDENGAALINNIFYNHIAANGGGEGVPRQIHVSGSLNSFVSDFNADLHQGNLYFPDANQTPGAAVVADPLLAALADNGGATSTMALGAGSPAINAGVVVPDLPLIDQRDLPRDDGSPDIGAFEVQ